jgi:hypothetical protein
MSITTTVHANFRGEARAALEFYQGVFGGEIAVITYRDAHAVTDESEADQVMWGQVESAAGFRLMAYDVPGGLFFRRVHRAAAHLFVAAVILHMLRVILTGAFRRPREINYHLGIVLLLLSFAAGFTGYSLPYDALAGTGIRIAYSELLSVPYAGPYLAFWIFGGEFPTGDVIPRFFVFHVLLLPGFIIAAVGAHIAFVVRQRHTQFPRRGLDGHRWILGKPLWPSQFSESTTLTLWIGGVLAGLCIMTALGVAPKHQLCDPALAARLLNVSSDALLTKANPSALPLPKNGSLVGALFESLATQSVQVYADAGRARVYHLRTNRGDHEIDLIVERGDGKVVAIEVKLTALPDGNDVKHLRWLRDKLGDDLLDAVVITSGPAAYRREDGIAVVPLALLSA